MNPLLWLAVAPLFGRMAAASTFQHQRTLRGTARSLQDALTSNFTVTDDVFARSSAPNRNYNDVTNLGVAYGEQHSERITYVKFPIDLDGVQNAASIGTAVVWMRLNAAPSVSMTIHVYRSDTEDWNEGTLTWNDRPGYDTSAVITSITLTPSDSNTWVGLDVSAAFSVAVENGNQNSFSLVLQAEAPVELDPASQLVKFDSKEDGTHIPYMTVSFLTEEPSSSPSVQPSTAPTVDYDQPEYPPLVTVGVDGSLVYTPYANEINLSHGSTANPGVVNTVPDFSGVGYDQGRTPIPFVPVQATLSPTESDIDRRADIQEAIDMVATLPMDENGFRGAVLLKAGYYQLSEPGLTIVDSGIVLRGEGQGRLSGTILNFTSTNKDANAITVGLARGKYESIEPNGTHYSVTDSFVPVGSNTLSISNTSTMSVGDRIAIKLQPNSDWLLHMSNMQQWGWNTQTYQVIWLRVVTAVNGDQLTLDRPVVHPIEAVYGGAQVYRYELLFREENAEIENVGVENIRLESIYASEEDENHGKHAVMVQRVRNGWIRQLTAQYFWQGAVLLRRQSYQVTVEDSAALDPKGTLKGGRRYPFVIDEGHSHLFQRNYAKDFRHTFASSSRTSGPHVFVDGSAPTTFNDIGPHERFATGQLYDNIRTDIHAEDDGNGGEMNAVNRGPSGSGHGWAGVQIMFWNCIATQWRLHAANGAMSWAIGMIGDIGDRNRREPEPDGIFQSLGSFVMPRSLYYAQLQDRLGANALHHAMLPMQKAGPIWNALDDWAGDGLFGDAVVAWTDEEVIAVVVDIPVVITGVVRDLNLLGNSPEYEWTVLDGPFSNFTIEDSTALETTVTFEQEGTYTLSLSVSTQNTSAVTNLEIQVLETLPEEATVPPKGGATANARDDSTLPASAAVPSLASCAGSVTFFMGAVLLQIIS